MGFEKCTSFIDATSLGSGTAPLSFSSKVHEKAQFEKGEMITASAAATDVDIDIREVYFLIMQFLSSGPCQTTFRDFWNELQEHHLLPRRYHAWYSRGGVHQRDANDNHISLPLTYNDMVDRYPHIEKDHLIKLLKKLILNAAPPLHGKVGGNASSAVVPTLLGTGCFSLLKCDGDKGNKQVTPQQGYLRWPHMQADQVRGLSLREIGGGFTKHHRAPSIRSACYAIAKPSTMVQKMQNIKKLRGHRDAVYCAIYDRSGRYVITGSDDRLVKIWSMETAFCLASCRGHEGDITDLAVSSNNDLVASASNDFIIRVWRLPDGLPISVLRGHTGAVTAIAFSPRPSSLYHLLSSSDDGTCRIWDARFSQCNPRVYTPKPSEVVAGKSSASSNGPSSSNGPQSHQILCCAYNANGTVFVTGSSDTYARVWNACKFKTDDLEQPVHEMDVLSGHENDVNYVQFSGCAVASKCSMSDSMKEDNFPKFKNSWFCHDNIVTCSRDGSAIIWIPRSRRSHGKIGRWTRAYHLKVPPPPMPPQPPRGGPRQRLLPTPRGVNMIVWSLDNRFVLAAIMDCRICVWNAADGSLVHSLTGHNASTYVLDVHPFNPRIAMSAGYDGKTIVWDIWEGKPVRIYEIGRFKLVDGKFSPDGASIVLSDDVGQIYLLSTGQGESQKDAKYDQFFLGDYRPLLRDTPGNILDQETQLVPYRRNMQDLLCDPSMIPYSEPYQTMYQQRRLGALNIEWRPASIEFIIGPDISLGQGYQLLPLADLDRIIEPLPEFIDVMNWEPETEVISDDADSEYNLTEEYTSDNEQGILGGASSSDPECSAEESEDEVEEEDGLRRSQRNKHKAEVEQMTSSGRHVKRRILEERDGTRTKKLRNGCKVSRRKPSKPKSSRPQRVAARNACNMFSQFTGTSTNGEDEDDSSDKDSMLQDSTIQSSKSDRNLRNVGQKYPRGEQPTLSEFEETVKPLEPYESQPNVGNRRRLVFKLSIRDSKKTLPLGNSRPKCDDQSDLVYSSSRPPQDAYKENRANLNSEDPGSLTVDAIDAELSQNLSKRESEKVDHLETSAGEKYIKKCTSTCLTPGDVMPPNASAGSNANDVSKKNRNTQFSPYSEIQNYGGTLLSQACTDEEQFGTSAAPDPNCAGNVDLGSSTGTHKSSFEQSALGDHQLEGVASAVSCKGNVEKECPEWSISDKCQNHDSLVLNDVAINDPREVKVIPPLKSTKIRFKLKSIMGDHKSPPKPEFITVAENSNTAEANPDGFDGYIEEKVADASNYNHDMGTDLPESATDAVRRTRSMGMKPTSKETDVVSRSCRTSMVREGHDMVGTSRNAENISMRADHENLYEERTSSSKVKFKLRSSRSRGSVYYDNDPSSTGRRKSNYPVRKASWLMLTEHELSYRYIPQLGDKVVYLRQGHQEYVESSQSLERLPWSSITGNPSAVEICTVEGLDYSPFPGSGESCCKIRLKFVDPSSDVFGEAFSLTLPELISFPDFIVEKTRYDAALERNWTQRDKCQVWWRSENGEGGSWWEGRIVSSEAKSPFFPDSPWERYFIRYEEGSTNLHSPWELHELDDPWKHPHMDSESRDKLLSSFAKLEQSDKYGIQTWNEAAQRLEYLNRFPAPLYPEVIKLRLESNYYRNIKSVKHDIMVMLSNAQSYFAKYPEILAKMRRLSDRFTRTLSKL